MKNNLFPIKVFSFISVFVLLTIIGTQLHEYGHYIVAYYLNFEPQLHYGSVSYNISSQSEIYSKTKVMIIKMAGPAQTMLMGIMGLLVVRLSKVQSKMWWMGIFSSLFLLRQVFIMLFAFANSFINGKLIFGGDEAKIGRYFGLHPGVLVIVLGLVSSLLCGYIIFVAIPKKIRLSFIIGSAIGSALGFIIWFYLIGEIILP